MPSIIKRKTSHVAESPFQVYAGDDPKPGGYRAILRRVSVVKSSGDNLMYKPILELKAAPGSDKSKYDGYPVFPQIVMTDNESNLQREQAFYQAVCGKKDADVSTDVDPSKFKPSDGQKAKVLKIGGVKPEDIVVNVKLRIKPASGDYPAGLECDMIFASRDEQPAAPSTDEEDEEADGEEEIAEYTEDELMEMGLPALRAILVDEFGVDAADAKLIKVKKTLVARILEEQAAEEDEDEDAEEDEEEEESDEESDEEEEEEDDDPEAELRAELAELDRTALKERIKKMKSDFKFLKSQSDADLVDWIVKNEPPF
jgi:hypothetical protein